MDWGRATVPVRQRTCLEAQGCSASSTGARIKDRQVLHRHWMEEVSRAPLPPPPAPSLHSASTAGLSYQENSVPHH